MLSAQGCRSLNSSYSSNDIIGTVMRLSGSLHDAINHDMQSQCSGSCAQNRSNLRALGDDSCCVERSCAEDHPHAQQAVSWKG